MYISDATEKRDICSTTIDRFKKIDRTDVVQILKLNPDSTFLMRVTGFSMVNAGINSGDIVVADKKKVPKNGDIVIAEINKSLTIKRLIIENNRYVLKAENENYPTISIKDDDTLNIWGVVKKQHFVCLSEIF